MRSKLIVEAQNFGFRFFKFLFREHALLVHVGKIAERVRDALLRLVIFIILDIIFRCRKSAQRAPHSFEHALAVSVKVFILLRPEGVEKLRIDAERVGEKMRDVVAVDFVLLIIRLFIISTFAITNSRLSRLISSTRDAVLKCSFNDLQAPHTICG